MEISGYAYLEHARDGRMVASFEPCRPKNRSGDDPHAFDHLMDGLRCQIRDGRVRDAPVEPLESIGSARWAPGAAAGTPDRAPVGILHGEPALCLIRQYVGKYLTVSVVRMHS